MSKQEESTQPTGLLDRIKSRLSPGRRVRVPTVLQLEAVECGAAALTMVMEKYGLIVPLEEVRQACGVSRDGSKASNILRAARNYGFKANGFRRDIKNIKTGELPVIIHWNFNHFVVLEGYGKDCYYLNDPGVGPRKVSEAEFDNAFTGVTIIVQPGPDFKAGGKKPSVIESLRQRMAGSGSALGYILLASFFITLLGLIIPSFTRIFIDRVLFGGLTDWITPLLATMGIAALILVLLTWLQQHYLLRLESKLALATSARFFWHTLRLPIVFFDQRHTADISGRVEINDRIARLLSGELATNVLNILLIIFYFVVMIRYDVLLTVIGVVVAALNLVALRYLTRRRTDINQRLLTEQGKFTSVAFSGLQTIETLKATGRESDFFTRWAGTQAKATNAEQELSVSNQLLSTIPALLFSANTILILVIGGFRVMNGQLSVGELIAFQALLTSFLLPINQMVTLGDRLQTTRGEMIRLDDVLRYPIDKYAKQSSEIVETDSADTKLSGQLELRNVTFGYSRLDPPLISNFNLVCKPGSRIALVGGSGSGKSTVAKLVAGIYEPWSGEILFDGKQRGNIPATQMKNSVGMVNQEIYLFEGSVRHNITMWDDSISDVHVTQAAKDAAIHDNIASRAGGYEFMVAEAGGNFSGGQRQRLEIARALAQNPTILVMDEATSALDPLTEKIIDDNLRRRGCTCLIVAHRLSTIRDCDEIIVMQKGKIVQRGTHNQMIRMEGPYAKLIKADESSQSKKQSIFDLLEV
jgi:NHLM bacteriocin system ABC transporter peptidase/ATP-binding protein